MACQNKIVLQTSATITTTSQTTAVTVPAKCNHWVGYVTWGTVSGTTPTLDITIQHSADGTNWVTLIAFTQITTSTGSEHKFAAAATDYLKPLLPYVRLSYVVGGSASPTFNTVAVSLMVDC